MLVHFAVSTELEVVVVQLLHDALQGATVNAATKQLKQQLKRPASMLVLMKVLTHNSEPVMRLSAAVYLRQSIGVHWDKLGNAHAAIQSTLLEQVVREPE